MKKSTNSKQKRVTIFHGGVELEFWVNVKTKQVIGKIKDLGVLIPKYFERIYAHVEKTIAVKGDTFSEKKGIAIVSHKLMAYLRGELIAEFIKKQKCERKKLHDFLDKLAKIPVMLHNEADFEAKKKKEKKSGKV